MVYSEVSAPTCMPSNGYTIKTQVKFEQCNLFKTKIETVFSCDPFLRSFMVVILTQYNICETNDNGIRN